MDMGGWDVITASNVAKINAVLAASTGKLLPQFSFTDSAQALSFQGSFGPWAIQPGGSANRINLLVPITTGTLSFPEFSTPLSLDGVKPILNLALTLVEGTSSGTQSLVFNITTNSATPSNADGAVYIANPDETGLLAKRDPTKVASQLFRDWFGEIFVQNKAKISFVFATVFSNPQGQPWLTPKATSVSYFESLDRTIQAVGIRTLTQSPWGPSGLTAAVDPSLLIATDDYFFSMAEAVFLRNLLLPAVAAALGVPTSSLRFNGPSQPNQQNSCSITNATNISLPSVENAGTHYYPVLSSYSVTISNNQIITTGSGSFDITGLHDAYVTFDNLRVVNAVAYNPSTRQLTFSIVSENSPSTSRHIPWYEEAIAWIVPVIGAIVTIVMNIVVSTIESSVENAVKGTGSLSVGTISLSTAVWAGLDQVDVTEADLADAFVIRAKAS